MAVNEAEARMKSKAGVIGRSEGGELVCTFFVEKEMESFVLFCILLEFILLDEFICFFNMILCMISLMRILDKFMLVMFLFCHSFLFSFNL